ncbi:MAG TPA: polysaccharide deacetylase family protein [Caulobacteraceae bacterium]|jgi:peptidoglycan/xylan/chitin deacetylase (PgdA/CDA1 family)
MNGLLPRAAKAAQVRLARNIKINGLDTRLDEPVVSFTFDDFPRSALTEGGRILRERGWAGAYFAAGGFCGRRVDGLDYFDRDDLVQAAEEGHEIGCHTFSHLRLPDTSAREIQADLERNAAFIADVLPDHRLSSFAYPYGDLDLGKKALLGRRFPICRGIWPGINAGRMDFAQLKAVPLERRSLANLDVEAWLDRVQAERGWLIFFTHDVSDDPSDYGCSRQAFEAAADAVARRGIRVLPVKNAVGLARFAA